jgi:hypothetical protein
MQINERDEHPENAVRPIRDSLEPDSNVADPRLLHLQKQFSGRSSTDEGIQISRSDEQRQNVDLPIDKWGEPHSNVTVARPLQE